MSIQRVIIELSPSRIEVATTRNGVLGEWRRERVARAEWPSPFTTVLPEAAGVIGKLLAEMGVSAASATVIYSTPGSVTGLTSCAASINTAGAEQAAMLALTNMADFPIEDAPSDSCTLLTDRASRKRGDPDAPMPQRHILACADSEDRAAALCEALSLPGIAIEGLVPAEAVATADAMRLATASSDTSEIAAVVWIGEHSTSLAVGTPGRLFFVRTITAGTEALAEVLCRPLRSRDADAAPITLSHEEARTLLMGVGVPAPDALIPGYPNLAGSALLPHLQPILQRLSIEIKQSLRFGVSEDNRAHVRLRLAGPGAAVPGLGDAISRVSGFGFDAVIDPNHPPDANDSSCGGLIAAFSRCPTLSICILPAQVRQVRTLRKARKALLIGAALAFSYVGYETFDAYSTLRSERGRLTELTSAMVSSQGPMAVRQNAMASCAAMADAERRLRKAMDQSPDWATMLEIISHATPAEMRLTSLDMTRNPTRCAIDMRGHIRFEEVADPAALIRSYVKKLESVPLVDGVRLGAASRAPLAGHDAQTFSLTIGVLPLPPVSDRHATAAVRTEAK